MSLYGGLPDATMMFEESEVGMSAAPAFSATTVDLGPYLSLGAGKSATLALPSTREVSVYVGSLDSYNAISFGGPGGGAYSGSQLGAVSGSDNGDQRAADTNGRFFFTFAAPVDRITLSASGNAFEVADIAATVPEPAGWALMLAGVGGLGAALRAKRCLAPAA